jgi:hypothetical protein
VRGALPSRVAPSRNWTAPEGVPKADVTVAVKVTVCPTVAGFGEEINEVVVLAGLMVCANAAACMKTRVKTIPLIGMEAPTAAGRRV